MKCSWIIRFKKYSKEFIILSVACMLTLLLTGCALVKGSEDEIRTDALNISIYSSRDLSVESFEITERETDKKLDKDFVVCKLELENSECTVYESIELNYVYNEAEKHWHLNEGNVTDREIIPKNKPTKESAITAIQEDLESDVSVEILDEYEDSSDPLSYHIEGRTEQLSNIWNYHVDTKTVLTHDVIYQFEIDNGWQVSTVLSDYMEDNKYNDLLVGHYEGTTIADYLWTGEKGDPVPYSFDISVSDDGKSMHIDNLTINQRQYPESVGSNVDESAIETKFEFSAPPNTNPDRFYGHGRIMSSPNKGVVYITFDFPSYNEQYQTWSSVWDRSYEIELKNGLETR